MRSSAKALTDGRGTSAGNACQIVAIRCAELRVSVGALPPLAQSFLAVSIPGLAAATVSASPPRTSVRFCHRLPVKLGEEAQSATTARSWRGRATIFCYLLRDEGLGALARCRHHNIIEQLTSLDRDIVQPTCAYGLTSFDLNPPHHRRGARHQPRGSTTSTRSGRPPSRGSDRREATRPGGAGSLNID